MDPLASLSATCPSLVSCNPCCTYPSRTSESHARKNGLDKGSDCLPLLVLLRHLPRPRHRPARVEGTSNNGQRAGPASGALSSCASSAGTSGAGRGSKVFASVPAPEGATAMAATACPSLFSSVIFLDPVIVPPVLKEPRTLAVRAVARARRTGTSQRGIVELRELGRDVGSRTSFSSGRCSAQSPATLYP
jgi:hypothetical protein